MPPGSRRGRAGTGLLRGLVSFFQSGDRGVAAGSIGRVGRLGERAARKHLKRARYRILGRSIVTPAGEADLVCLDPDRRTIVVVEVKARGSGASGPPPERRVGREKSDRLVAVARSIRARRGWTDRQIRIDVIGVDLDERGRAREVRHFRNAVTPR